MINTRFYLLIACVALIFVSCARKPLSVQGHYYAMEGYRPVVLPGTKTVAENPFPLSAYEKGETFRQCGVRLPDVFGEISRP